jgi:ATP-dependent Lon protease
MFKLFERSKSSKAHAKKDKKSEKNKKNAKKNLKRGRADPPSDDDDDDEDISLDDVDSDEYETSSDIEEEEEEEEEDDSDSTYVPPKKNRRSRICVAEEEEEDEEQDEIDEDDEDDEDEEGECDEDEDEDENLDPHELRKTLAVLFPSNYINQKVRDDENSKNRSAKNYKSASKTKKSSNLYRGGKRVLKNKKNKEDEEEGIDEDDDEEDDVYDDAEGLEDEQDFNIVFTLGGGNEMFNPEDVNAVKDDLDDDCNSDDEQMFMKENYQAIDVPDVVKEKEKKAKAKKEKAEKKAEKKSKRNVSNKSDKSENTDDANPADAENEYKELVELKKHLSEELTKKPKSKILIRAIEECRASIKKLVKKTRMKNAKKYYKMLNEMEDKQESEIDYFKKQLSNKEQLRAMKELKDVTEHMTIKKPYRLTLLDSNMPSKFKATVLQKINMLKMMEPGEGDYYKLKCWVDGFMRVPFNKYKNLEVSIADGIEKCSDFMENAKKILDTCVYGLDDAKMQIMQMLGQWITNPDAMGSAIAIKGPMGTGKTSLVKDGISKILGREFAFIALGGTGDASYLEGHGYTYEGSMWGKIVQILIDSKCMNPVIYFDELDKVSDTARGEEIIGILTHLTDTTQNSQFHDKYFSEIDFDLSKCLFIFSYNDESKVNPILRDRMYRIQTKGYDTKQKVVIARDFLLPKIREQVSFKAEDVIIPDETIETIINLKDATKSEEGVRNLKRCLEIIHTKLNLFRLMRPENNLFAKEMDMKVSFPITVTKQHVEKFIKSEEYQNQSLLAMYC